MGARGLCTAMVSRWLAYAAMHSTFIGYNPCSPIQTRRLADTSALMRSASFTGLRPRFRTGCR
eukprot:2895802-Pyramimonas_sp.AAC.1